MKKKHKPRLSAQTMCFFSITHPVYIQVFLRTLADVSVSDMFNSQLLPSCIFLSFIFHFILQWCPPGRAPRLPTSPAAAPLPQIKYDEVEWKLKTPARGFYKPALVLSRLKNFVKVPGRTGFCVDTENAAVWAQRVQLFSVSPLAKFLYILISQKFWTETSTEDNSQRKFIPLWSSIILLPVTGNSLYIMIHI